MTVRLVIGRAGSGKTYFCLDEIRKRLQQSPNGDPLILLVPEQASFQAEYALVSNPDLAGMMRCQALSFRRLAWRVMQDTGGTARIHIDDSGKTMLLQKIMLKNKEKLRLFRVSADQNGFVAQLNELFTEMRRYQVSSSRLEEYARKCDILQSSDPLAGKKAVFTDKLADLLAVYRDFEAELSRLYLDSEDVLGLLANHLGNCSYARDAEVWIDGFHGFTPQEFAVIVELMRHSRRVTITLCADKWYNEEQPANELDLFNPTASTMLRLQQLAEQTDVRMEEPVLLDRETLPRYASTPELAHLEKHFESRIPFHPVTPSAKESAEDGSTDNKTQDGKVQRSEVQAVSLHAAVNRRAEVEGTAREIIRLVRDSGYRWRDCAIMLRNIEGYFDLLTTTFADYAIPCFFDQKRDVLHHPLIELIRSALETISRNWRYEAVFRCVKTGFFLSDSEDASELGEQKSDGSVLTDMQHAALADTEGLARRDMDDLENYVLAFGIHGSRWTDGVPWNYTYRRTIDEEGERAFSPEDERFLKRINASRERVAQPLAALQRSLKQAANVREMLAAVYDLLCALDAPQRLQRWSEASAASGHAEKAKEHAQIWGKVIDLFDQTMELMGEEKISLEQFVQLLDTGLQNIRLGLIPPSLDQVLVGSMDRTRPFNSKCVFILGVNEGVIPAKPKEDGVLSEIERETLIETGLEMAHGSRRKLLDEQFLIYTAMTAPSDQLWLSYSLADDEGKAMLPSQLIRRIQGMFPHVPETMLLLEPPISASKAEAGRNFVTDVDLEVTSDTTVTAMGEVIAEITKSTLQAVPDDIAQAMREASATAEPDVYSKAETAINTAVLGIAGEHLQYIVRPEKTLPLLAAQLREWIRGVPIAAIWWDVYNWFCAQPQWREQLRAVLGSLAYANVEAKLQPQTGKLLYGERLLASVSRMELFASCPFSHFASYGLKLAERRVYRLQAPDIGQLFHASLSGLASRLLTDNVSWGELTAEECLRRAAEVVDLLAPKLQGEILFSSKRHRYIAKKLTDVIGRAAVILGEHARKGGFAPLALEVGFGSGQSLPPLILPLRHGGKMEVIGRIDRVDRADSEKGALLRVIDYKSGATRLNLPEVYYGLSLQMLTYLDVAISHAQQWLGVQALPAGALYFHVHNPLIQAKKTLSPHDAENELLKKFRMHGLLLADREAVQLMDHSLENSGMSFIIPAGFKKDGTFAKRSAVVPEERWDALRGYVRRTISRIGDDITEGNVAINPYRLKKRTPCSYCSYKPVCQFDHAVGNRYRFLPSLNADQVWQCIDEEENGNKPDVGKEKSREPQST